MRVEPPSIKFTRCFVRTGYDQKSCILCPVVDPYQIICYCSVYISNL